MRSKSQWDCCSLEDVLSKICIYARLHEKMSAAEFRATTPAAEFRARMLADLSQAAGGYNKIYGSLGRRLRGIARPAGGTDVFIGTLDRLCNGKGDMTSCLEALTCFTEFLDCGPKKGPDSSFADIYNDPACLLWKVQWVMAITSMVEYIKACEWEYPEDSAALLAQYEWASIQGKVEAAKRAVLALADAAQAGGKSGPVSRVKGLLGLTAKDELPAAHVLGQMRGLLLELGA